MPEINISKELSRRLGESRNNQINELVNFEESLMAKLNDDKCNELMRENITKKMQALTVLLVKISQIVNARHFSNDTKDKCIESVLGSFNLESFRDELLKELDSTKKVLLGKSKLIAKGAKEDIVRTVASIEKVISDNIQINSESLKAARKKEEALRRGEDIENVDLPSDTRKWLEDVVYDEDIQEELEADKMGSLNKQLDESEDKIQTAMIEYKSKGFRETFRRLWEDRNNSSQKKQGFFSVLKQSLISTYGGRESKKEIKKQIEELYAKQCEIASEIRRIEKAQVQLTRQKKDVRRAGISLGDVSFSFVKDMTDKLIEPIPPKEITVKRVGGVADKIKKFSGNFISGLKEWEESIKKEISKALSYTLDDTYDIKRRDKRLEADKLER